MGFSESIYVWLGVRTPFDPQARYVTSYILPPLGLAIWRSLISIYTFVTLILVYVFGGTVEFSFFTVLSYWGVCAYFTMSAIHTISYTIAYTKWKRLTSDGQQIDNLSKQETGEKEEQNTKQLFHKPQSLLSKSFPKPLQFFHSLLTSTIVTFPLLVTIIFWTILQSGAFDDRRSTWENLSVHAFNLTFTMIDTVFLGRIEMRPWSHCFFCVLFLALYVAVAYITYAEQGFYTYDFLNQGKWGTGIVTGYIIGIGVGMVISFMIAQFIIFLRELVWSKIQKSGGWGSAKAAYIDDDALFTTSYGPGPEGEGGIRTDIADQEAQAHDWRQRWPKQIGDAA